MARAVFYTAVITTAFALCKAELQLPPPGPFPPCGEGDWSYIALFQATECPPPLQQTASFSCTRPEPSGPGCTGASFPISAPYSRLCGYVLAQGIGSPDGLRQHGPRDDENLLDGIIVSREGESKKEDLWFFLVSQNGKAYCPCNSNGLWKDKRIGENYFCDSVWNEPLFDGDGCEYNEECCKHNVPPFFRVDLGGTFTDPINLRICLDEDTDNENIAIFGYGLLVQ